MNIKVMFHTTTGNTGKVAEAIAAAAGVKAESIEGAVLPSEPIDLLFIGDGLYGGKAHKKTTEFINSLGTGKVKNAAVFATYGGQAHIGEIITKHLRDKGINVIGEPYTCKGKCWIFINRRHPDETDFEKAREFAKTMIGKLSANT